MELSLVSPALLTRTSNRPRSAIASFVTALGRVGVLELGLVDEAAPAELLDRSLRLHGLGLGGGVGDGDVVSIFREYQGDASADASAAAGDEGAFVLGIGHG